MRKEGKERDKKRKRERERVGWEGVLMVKEKRKEIERE